MTTRALLSQLKRHEGLGPVVANRTYVYRCTAGCRTVGYGRNLDAHALNSLEKSCACWNGDSITLDGADWLLALDAECVENQVADELPWTGALDPVRRDVLHNMAFQMGIGGLCRFVTTLGLIRCGRYGLAASAMLRSKWARQTPKRAAELAQQMRTGRYRDDVA